MSTQSIGTLISSTIRPNSSLDPIAVAFSNEIKGGHHVYATLSERNSIIIERRDWGMFVTVYNDGVNSKTYQLKYGYSDTNLMNNSNWIEFSSSTSSGNEWIDSIITRTSTPPATSSNVDGDRYLITSGATGDWTSYDDMITQWNSILTQWEFTTPTNGMSVRVDDEDNSIYKYEGTFNTGEWNKESLSQVRYIVATSSNGINYYSTTDPEINSYTNDVLYMMKFATASSNGGTMSLNINSLGDVYIKKKTIIGLINLEDDDIITSIIYNLSYDGTYFQLNLPTSDVFINTGVKYLIESTDNITIPTNHQYWVYGDLTIEGRLTNYGEVVIGDGALVMSGGTFSNFGTLSLVTLDSPGTPVYNQRNLSPITTSGDMVSTGLTLSYTPNINVNISVYVNGLLQYLGDGVTSSVDCFFGNPYIPDPVYSTFSTSTASAITPGSNLFYVSVAGLPSIIYDGLLVSCKVNLNYPNIDDLDIAIYEPSIGSLTYFTQTGNGVTGSSFINTVFSITSSNLLTSTHSPYTGYFDDDQGYTGFENLNGFNANGNWALYVENYGTMSGTISSVSLSFNISPTMSATPKTIDTLSVGDTLYWNESYSGFGLSSSTDKIDIIYNKN